MPTQIIYTGEPPPPPAAPVFPPLAPGDPGWGSQPLLQPTQPLPVQQAYPTQPMPPVSAPYQPVTPHPGYPYSPPGTHPMMVYQSAPQPEPSLLGGAVRWCVGLCCVVVALALVIVQLAPDRAAQLTTQLHRAATRSVADTTTPTDVALLSAQNATLRVSVTALTTDQLNVSVVNISDHAFAFASDAVLVRADGVDYVLPDGLPTVQLQPGDEHQIVISPVPAGTSLVLRVQVPNAEAVEMKVR